MHRRERDVSLFVTSGKGVYTASGGGSLSLSCCVSSFGDTWSRETPGACRNDGFCYVDVFDCTSLWRFMLIYAVDATRNLGFSEIFSVTVNIK